jgi:anti-anti-sigma factor
LAGQPPAAAPDHGVFLRRELAGQLTIYSQAQMKLSITRSTDNSADFVQIVGDVDVSDSRALGVAARQLIDGDAGVIYVDLADTTFMGSTLIAFLVHIGNNGTDHRPLVLCRPSPMAVRVIHMTGLDEVATVRPDLPPLWPETLDEPLTLRAG